MDYWTRVQERTEDSSAHSALEPSHKMPECLSWSANLLTAHRKSMGKRSISGLKIEDLTLGAGPEAVKGKTVTIQAIGRLNKGDVFCSTLAYGQPWKFKAGGHKSIAGLAKGVLGMRVGGKRRVRVSPHLGFRDQSTPANELFQIPVPPNSVLVFEIELLAVEDHL